MKLSISAVIASIYALFLVISTGAQTIQLNASAAPPSALAEVEVDGRPPVGLVLLDKLMSGRSKVGDQVHYVTLASVFDKDHNILIPAGSWAYGAVTRSKGSGMFGKRGELEFTCDYVVLPSGSHVPLTGSNVSGAGANDTAATVAVTLLVSPLGLLIKGGTITVDKGTPVTMYIPEGVRITPVTIPQPNVRADFALRNKDALDVVGAVTDFDGKQYTVRPDQGQDATVVLTDIKSVSTDVPPPSKM